MSTPSVLRDIGERRLIRDFIAPRFARMQQSALLGIGDDCAVVPGLSAGEAFVATTDPCPTPIVCLLDGSDWYHHGRLAVLINVSDLAAIGAHPAGMLVSIIMPESAVIGEVDRLLQGLHDAASEWHCPIIGGNVKDGTELTLTGSAFGRIAPTDIMRRSGASPGDRICIIGDSGVFMAAVLAKQARLNVPTTFGKPLRDSLYRPTARLREGCEIARRRLATSCIDASDGVGGALGELARASGHDLCVVADALVPPECVRWVSSQVDIDHRKLMLSWGDWQLVCTVSPGNLAAFADVLSQLGTPWTDIGFVSDSTERRVYIDICGNFTSLTNFGSERFAHTSYFTHGLYSYLQFLRTTPLTQECC